MLGRFAEQRIEAMTDIEISVMERLIEIPDPDIALSLFEGNSLGEPALDALMRHLRCFHGIVPGRIKSC